MDENGTQSQSQKTIRLTRAEVYAMRLSRPKKRGLKFGLAGLLLALVLGSVLWLFQDTWLPFWLDTIGRSRTGESPLAHEPSPGIPPPVSPAAAPPPPATPPPPPAPGELDYLSAALWNHSSFQLGVRRFNQSLDQFRQARRDRGPAALFSQAEEGALQAAQLFMGLQTEAPANVPLNDYAAQCQRLASEIRRARQPAPHPATATPSPTVKVPSLTPEELKHQPLYVEGARLFNQTLEQFKLYQNNQSRKDLLKPTEDSARQAARQFEELKRQVPESLHQEIDRRIHQCYGIVSACRGEQLKSGDEEKNSSPGRGTTGPSRRPALPAYQPPN